MALDDALPVTTDADPSDEAAADAFGRIFAPEEGETEEPAEVEAAEAASETDAEEADAEPVAEQETESEADEAATPPAPAPVVTLDDGTELTADEVKKSYLRQADYTRKTQALAEERKTAAAEAEQVRAERSTYAERLTQLEAVLSQQLPNADGLDAIRQTDPAEYAARMADITRQQQQLATVQMERQRVLQQQSEEAAKQHSQYLASERDRLLEAVPEWGADPTKAQADLAEMRSVGQAYGFSDQELDQVADHRAILLLRDAMAYRREKAARAKVQPKIAKAPVLKPGTTGKVVPKPATDLARKMERLKKNQGDPHAAAAVFMDLLD